MSVEKNNEFQLSRRYRVGALALLVILFLLLLLWRILPSYTQPTIAAEETKLNLAWQEFKEKHTEEVNVAEEAQGNNEYAAREDDAISENATPIRLFSFDPNTASAEDFTALGLPPRTVKTIMNYKAKNGKFYKKEDFQKMYNLSDKDYQRLAPYITIAGNRPKYKEYDNNTTSYQANSHQERKPAGKRIVDLNAADEAALLQLRGIGPAFSKRIINFRNGLGGFVKVEQLKEVYGFPDSTYQQLKSQLTVDANLVRKININTATQEQLAKHTYIGKKIAAQILQLRDEKGSFKEIEELRAIPLINEEKYRKIAPYLSTH